MIIFCTGISCSGRRELMAELENLCRKKGHKVGFFDVGELMWEAAEEAGVKFTEKVLDSDPAVLALARKTSLYEIYKLASEYQHAFIGVHACFRWRGILIEGLSYRDLVNFPADLFINVVDEIENIARRMEQNPQWSSMKISDINVWLDEEEFLTKQLASINKKPYFLVAKEHDMDNLYHLIFSQKPKFYLSYPITLLLQTPAEIEKIRNLGKKLSQRFILFDPLYVKDMNLPKPIESSNSNTKIPRIDQIDEDTIEQAKTRTITRDYQFIRQSDFVVVIYPTDKLSPGVLSEMNFASRYNKPVYAVFSHARSPFFENLCSEIFDSFEELEKFLVKNYEL